MQTTLPAASAPAALAYLAWWTIPSDCESPQTLSLSCFCHCILSQTQESSYYRRTETILLLSHPVPGHLQVWWNTVGSDDCVAHDIWRKILSYACFLCMWWSEHHYLSQCSSAQWMQHMLSLIGYNPYFQTLPNSPGKSPVSSRCQKLHSLLCGWQGGGETILPIFKVFHPP